MSEKSRNLKTIAIIGHGYVGQALNKLFPNAIIFDPKKMPSNLEKQKMNICRSAKLVIISVPTEQKENGSADTSIVESTFQWLREYGYVGDILIKSTVPPGTTDRLNSQYGFEACFSPELIGEGKYYIPPPYPHPTDMIQHQAMIIGGIPAARTRILNIFQKILGPHKVYRQTTTRTAELTKYAENSFLAVKVTFFNEFYEICKSFGIDYNDFRECLLLDPRIGESHTLIFPDNRGFGGKCLPKDVNAIVEAAKNEGCTVRLLTQVLLINDQFKKMND